MQIWLIKTIIIFLYIRKYKLNLGKIRIKKNKIYKIHII